MEPVAPVGPVAPVEPVAPVGPVGPTEPVAPVGPVAPVFPVGPVAPVAPFAPVGPTGPCSIVKSKVTSPVSASSDVVTVVESPTDAVAFIFEISRFPFKNQFPKRLYFLAI
jgi:hypothetical protein